ncbi:glycosyltransferase family 4 protein [Streptomyces sp. NBC_01803]|uniref:glycosyltransferase family 4 protein n=1 Tax=Streptomyces sp. NBC_01803 TaxID=2975946 RepID=UPI002DD84BA4|nr:glycosyltransferase family 4 protein [Streptomyces sp. NBC_01803]WSA46880.1 glycosyltransferase family 4 protein [Streptomyces sp. NBC_01803]
MSSSTAPPHGRAPLHVVQLLGGGSVGTGTHVRSLSAGLVARGLRVTVGAPASAERRYRFTAAGARFVPVPLPVRATPTAVGLLRELCADADLVHAHGMRAGMLAALALRRRAVPLVVTWHSRSALPGVRAQLRLLSEHWVARAASVVLGTTSDLVDRARSRGARDARLAPVALPARRAAVGPAVERHKIRAELGAVDRPLLVAEAILDRTHDLDPLLAAARAWRRLSPQPLVAVAGDGPERSSLQRRIDREELPVRLLGAGGDRSALLADADVALLIARWAARAPLAEQAMRRGVPLVATAVGGVPELVGDAAVLVPYGDSAALAAAVESLLTDAPRRAALAEAGRARAGSWPTEDTTVAQVLSVYDELAATG